MTNPSALPVSEQLARIVASPMFERADRLRQFLEFIVCEAVAGRAGSLKEYTVATRVFGKEAAFDPRTDPIVRVQARRLRTKLQRYYETDGADDPVVIEMPRGGYAPIIRAAGKAPVDSRVRSAVHRLRIHVQLIDGATGTDVWSEAFDGQATDATALQDRVAAAVRARLGGALRDTMRPVANLAAQSFYRQGRYHLDQRTEEGLSRAVTFFERAIAEDAQYAEAHAGLADAFGLLAHYGVLGPADAWPRTASAASTALMLDDQSAEALTSLAHVRATQDWDWSAAEEGFRRAIELDPRYTTAHHWYAASCLVPLGRLDEARDEMVIAQALDPVSSIIARDLAMVHCYRRDYDAALEQCDHTIELNPHFAPAYWALGIVQEQRGELDESAAAFRRAVLLSPRTPRLIGALGRALALAGRTDEAIAARISLVESAADRYVSPLDFAWIELGLGNVDAGVEWLGRAFEERAFDLINAHVDPRFDVIRADQRFVTLAGRLGLPAQTRR